MSDIKTQWSARRTKAWLFGIPAGIALAMLIPRRQEWFASRFWPLQVAVALIGLVVVYRNWRCPSCEKGLGRDWSPKHCSNCGTQLAD